MFENNTELIYLGTRTGVSKAGEPYNVLLVGNPEKYENYEFFISQGLAIPTLEKNEPIVCEIELSKRGYNLVPSLVAVTKAVVVRNK
ncbi:hypothetical protein IW492_17450 [Enterococcus sp. BWB1-3]|uniref:hypothetical protein n=1 Tax=Enterococcus sp. BWB1-3 TaxID=2787713 RepID=UPI0019228E75|nr:hypothetical protein [Enterococcus sp. BWB1-3]MBL1231013.1 hypothetical protein [Enterococcus sp. BWB1-3]